MAATGPAHTYYRACHGRWRSSVCIVVTDPGELRRAGMSWLDRTSLLLLARWPRWLGAVHMDTSVDYREGGEVVHTTVVRWLGLPLRRSTEVFSIAPDGAHLTVRGGMIGSGVVDETGTRVDYTLTWLGIGIRQHTERETDRVTVHQEGPGFHGVQELSRRDR
jgi:hypothetical protein